MVIDKYHIHKIIDVVLPLPVLQKISGMHTYEDKLLTEHIYNIDNVEDNCKQFGVVLNKKEQNLLDQVREACDKHDAAYFRPIFP
jgi:hypothetical protein